MLFQSTLPTRGSDTTGATSAAGISPFQSTLPTRGSDGAGGGLHCRPLFQSTLPTRESDPIFEAIAEVTAYFNPRSPRGGATIRQENNRGGKAISIHAPHEGERRVRGDVSAAAGVHFNPRSPRGGAT